MAMSIAHTRAPLRPGVGTTPARPSRVKAQLSGGDYGYARRDSAERRSRWAITRATCAISSSTCSRSSNSTRRWPAASSVTSTASRCARCSSRGGAAGRGPGRRIVRRGRPSSADLRPGRRTRCRCRSRSRSRCGLAAGRMVPRRARRGRRRGAGAGHRRVGDQRVGAGREPRGVPLHGRPDHGQHPVPHRQRAAAALGGAGARTQLGATMVLTEPDAGSDVGAGRTKAIEQPATAPGTSRASNGSSPTATPTTCSRTSCIWCWPAPRVRARAPRA